MAYFLHLPFSDIVIFLLIVYQTRLLTVTSCNKQTLFFVFVGQKYSTYKVSAQSETMRARPLYKLFGGYVELGLPRVFVLVYYFVTLVISRFGFEGGI